MQFLATLIYIIFIGYAVFIKYKGLCNNCDPNNKYQEIIKIILVGAIAGYYIGPLAIIKVLVFALIIHLIVNTIFNIIKRFKKKHSTQSMEKTDKVKEYYKTCQGCYNPWDYE